MPSLLSFDTETYLIRPGRLAPRLVCASVKTLDSGPMILERRRAVEWFLSAIRLEVPIVGHNVAYDLAVMCVAAEEFGHGLDALRWTFEALEAGRIHDTRIREMLIAIALDWSDFDPRTRKPFRTSLADLVKARFGVELAGKTGEDAWRLRYAELEGVPVASWPEAAREYVLADAEWPERIYFDQSRPLVADTGLPIVTADGVVVNEAEQVAAAFALHLMSCWGVRTDAAAVDVFGEHCAEEIAKGDAIGRAAGFVRPDGSKDMKVLRARVEAAYTGREVPRTEKGATSTDSETLAESGDEVLVEFNKTNVYRKYQSTYLPILRDGTRYPVNPSFNILVKSGRTSAREPNIQNPPRKGGFRECFVARPGYVFCSVDYNSLEMRSLAQVCLWWFGHSILADALIDGVDPHTLFAAERLLGVPYDVAAARVKAGDPAAKSARQLAKVANFGFPGGLSAPTFVDYAKAQGVVVTPEKADEMHAAFRTQWPEMREYFQRIGNECSSGKFTAVQAVSNRQRGGCTFTSGANTYFQGLAADGAKAAVYAVARECYDISRGSYLFGSRPWAFVHDEILAELPEDKAALAAPRMAEVMCSAMANYIPDIPILAEPALMRRWFKDAEPVYTKSGKLVPWEPKTFSKTEKEVA